ncbi:MAG: LacI family DNA-binding transcriptional regulator [Opitutae bacterium]
MSGSLTMKTVAAQAGVTQATVSMCLANNPRIPLATRERIRAVASKLGYQPNPYVSALMRVRRLGRKEQDQPIIALLNGLESPTAWRNASAETVRQMHEGAVTRAEERGYRAEEFWLHQDGMTAARLSQVLHARGIHGVLLGPLEVGAPIPDLKWDNFSAVRLGVPLPSLTVTSVGNDHFFSSLQVMRECWELGYRRPGLVILDYHPVRFQGRWNGGLLVAERLLPGTAPVPPLLLKSWDDLTPLTGWLRRAKPDVIISPSAGLLHRHLRAKGWKLPRDLGVASLACPRVGDAVSGIFQNGALIGATGIDTVIGMLERNERGLPAQAHAMMIEGVWNPGKTLRKMRRR